MSRRWRRYDAPPKERLHASSDERIAERMRQMKLPAPPPGFREQTRRNYDEWLQSRAAVNRWRD